MANNELLNRFQSLLDEKDSLNNKKLSNAVDATQQATQDLDNLVNPNPVEIPMAPAQPPLEIPESVEKEPVTPLEKANEVSDQNDIVKSESAPKEPTKSKQIRAEAVKQEKKQDLKESQIKNIPTPEKEEDSELRQAKLMDIVTTLFKGLDKAASHFTAANPNVQLKPIQVAGDLKANFVDKLLAKRKESQAMDLASKKETRLKDYMDKQLQIQEKGINVKEKQFEHKMDKDESRKNEREKREDRLHSKQILDSARGLLKDDPRFKKAVEQGMEFESVNRLLAEAEGGNQAALAALGTKLARAMGEVGVLTDTDVVRYVGGTSWGRKLKDWFDKGAKGELSPETLKDIKTNLNLLKGKLGEDVNRIYENAETRMKTAYPDLDNSTIQGLLGKPIMASAEDEVQKQDNVEAPYGDTVEKNGKTYKWNASKGKYQILK